MIAFVLKISAPVKCTQKIIFFSKPAHPAEAAACFQQIPLLSESFINLFSSDCFKYRIIKKIKSIKTSKPVIEFNSITIDVYTETAPKTMGFLLNR